jgi:hypothetical protein
MVWTGVDSMTVNDLKLYRTAASTAFARRKPTFER